jgi:hypothetical protein
MRKITNQPREYLSRAKLSGGATKYNHIKVSSGELEEHARRDAAASIDSRWYISWHLSADSVNQSVRR